MLYEPIRIGRLELKNRLVMPPMQTSRSDAGHVSEDMLNYYRERAIYSGPALIITEHNSVTEAGRANREQLSIASDDLIEEHRRLAGTIHEAGSRVFAQLNHAGSNAMPLEGVELISASDVNVPLKDLPTRPRPLTEAEIAQLEDRFAEAALRVVKAGYDGVEIHSAHGYLLNQFYSPMTNLRTDTYGAGSIENRTRFLVETVAKVRSAVGADFPLAVRLGGADYLPGGATEEDAVAACRILEQAGVDLLDISGGMCYYKRPDHREPGFFSSMTEKIRAAVSVPVLLTGGIRLLQDAEQLLTEGKADLIGVGRPLYKDAHWAEKA